MAMLDSLNTKGISRYEAALAYIAGTLSQGLQKAGEPYRCHQILHMPLQPI